ncbi:MAG: CbtB-domain containing protein [Deltaproteobacteria bacterium]|nr:CbtB-domain containing protein [Deltaproteobacteria bacterium]
MEKALDRDVLWSMVVPALVVFALAFALVVVAYGFDSAAPGAHDAFHDFRHMIGMPCH